MRRLGWLLVGLALTGCGAAPDDLSLEFGKNVRKIGVFPVYPPREEFQIGDVYAWSQSLTNPNDTISIYVSTVDWMRKEADRFMASRIVFESANVADPAKSVARVIRDVPDGHSGLTLRRELVQDSILNASLPIAAFPSISADAGFSYGVGIARLLTAVGLAGSTRTQVTLNFNDVRTYWVPNVEVSGKAIEARNAAYKENRYAIDREVRRAALARLGRGVDPCRPPRHCGISIVTRVYLTRRIDYTYRNAQIIAGAMRAARPGTRRQALAAAPAITVNVASADGRIDPAAVDAIRTQLDTFTATEGEGASFRFEAWDARGMTFASEYIRPVVVGWDGLSASIVLNNGE